MSTDKSDPVKSVTNRLSELYVGLEDFAEESSAESLLKVLALLRDLRMAVDIFDRSAVAVLRRHDVSWSEIASSLGGTREDVLQRFRLAEGEFGVAEQHLAALLVANDSRNEAALINGNIYTRNDLRELFQIRDATLNNGVFHFRERREVWLFVTENKQADRQQYVDKLVGDSLHWQGQRMGRTDSLIIDHKRTGENLLLFYRKAKYEFEGAGFRYEGVFEYVSHSGSHPTSFVLRRAVSLGSSIHVPVTLSRRVSTTYARRSDTQNGSLSLDWLRMVGWPNADAHSTPITAGPPPTCRMASTRPSSCRRSYTERTAVSILSATSDISSCSHTRITVHPAAASASFVWASRERLVASFSSQKATFLVDGL